MALAPARYPWPSRVSLLDVSRLKPVAALAASVAAAAMVLTACVGPWKVGAPTGPPKQPSASASASNPADLAAFYGQHVTWSDCNSGFWCAEVTVPISYDDPTGSTVKLKVVSLPATGTVRGSLVLNPGGPGGSGVDYARALADSFDSSIRDAYNIVGFDPRGIGGSSPVNCVDDATVDLSMSIDSTPDNPSEIKVLEDLGAKVRAGCAKNGGELVTHMSTEENAKDLDILRAVLGDAQLNYIGKSYGTDLGATYASMFPTNVGRMVLDGDLPPTLDGQALGDGQAGGFEVAVNAFAADCLTRSDCPLAGPTTADAVASLKNWWKSLDSQPISLADGRTFTEGMASYAVLMFMYLPESDWPFLRGALGSAMSGEPLTLVHGLDQRMSRASDGHYSDNSSEAFWVVSCTDRPSVADEPGTETYAKDLAAKYPTVGAYFGWGFVCDGWPTTSKHSQITTPIATPGPVLVVSTTRDPATPYAWGQEMVDLFSQAELLSYDADGHTAYMHGSKCVDVTVNAYLLTGNVDSSQLTC